MKELVEFIVKSLVDHPDQVMDLLILAQQGDLAGKDDALVPAGIGYSNGDVGQEIPRSDCEYEACSFCWRSVTFLNGDAAIENYRVGSAESNLGRCD